jgi:hypothetical protein
MEATPQILEALVKIQIEYVQMPQLKLTARQVRRLWSLPHDVCEAALAALICKGFLVHLGDGAYVRHHLRHATIDRVDSLVRAS